MSADSDERDNNRLAEAVAALAAKRLETDGRPFQFSVLRQAEELLPQGWSHWILSVVEFPVMVGNTPVHIDAILRARQRDLYMVVECKRVNPAFGEWCFVKAPYVRRDHRDFLATLDSVTRVSAGMVVCHTVDWAPLKTIHDFGFEVRSPHAKGDVVGAGRGEALDQALTQVFRGVNGVVEALQANLSLLTTDVPWRLLPVIMTTARLWTVNAPLEARAKGAETVPVTATPATWLAMNCPVSPALRHTAHRATASNDLSEHFAREHIRTVFVVSVAGVADFLQWSSQYP